jgi:hypothetical protein
MHDESLPAMPFPPLSSTLLEQAGADAPSGQLRSWMLALPKTIQHYLSRWEAEWTGDISPIQSITLPSLWGGDVSWFTIPSSWDLLLHQKKTTTIEGLDIPFFISFLEYSYFLLPLLLSHPKVTFFRVILNTLFKGHKYLCGRSLNEVVQHQRSPFSG